MFETITFTKYNSCSYKKYIMNLSLLSLRKDLDYENIAYTDNFTICVFIGNIIVNINKFDDDYYKVYINDQYNDILYFLCDQYDGLIEFLKSLINDVL